MSAAVQFIRSGNGLRLSYGQSGSNPPGRKTAYTEAELTGSRFPDLSHAHIRNGEGTADDSERISGDVGFPSMSSSW